MAGEQVRAFRVGSVQWSIVLQLFCCHCLILVVTVAYGASVLPVITACLLSFLLLLNIPYNLHLLEMTLERLARGLSVEPFSSRLHWLLTRLFALVNALAQQSGQQVQREQRNVAYLAYRDQLLQQVSKTAAQEERNRLARDLHDSIKQQIFSIVVNAAAVKARWEYNPAGARKAVDDIERTAQEAQVEMQALLQQLRPTALENVGLVESLRMQCQALGYRIDAEITTELSELPPEELLPVGAQEMIFRIVQEGFANIARHARAAHVWLSLRQQGDALLVEIGDDGQGFELAQVNERPQTYGGMGLSNVRERVNDIGGTLKIWSLPGKGTTLHLCIPLVRTQLDEAEQELANQEFAHVVQRTGRILRTGQWIAELAAVLILLAIPAFIAQWVVFICIVLTLILWLWAQQHRLQIALDFGRRDPQYDALLAKSYGLLSGLLLLCILYPSYLLAFHSFTPVVGIIWLASAFYVIFASTILVAYVLYFRYSSRYHASLAGKVLREEIRQQLQRNGIDWTAWVIVLALFLFQLKVMPGILTDATVQGMAFVLLFAWFICLLLKTIRIVYWQRSLRKPTMTTTHKHTSQNEQEEKGDSI